MEVFVIVTVLWVFSVCLHEFGHALVAYWGGDHSVREKGYLTLNPLHYTHPVYSLLMPVGFMMLGGIGLPGGAVYIERHRLRSRGWETGVSLAGPAMNVPLILLIGLAFKIGWLQNDAQSVASVSLGFLLQLEISAVILNLLPIPPLDGFQAIAPWLSVEVRERLHGVSSQALWVFFLALWFVPPLNQAFWDMVRWFSGWFGVDPYLGYVGWKTFRFWDGGTF
jgi:Zn-dependent protease